jgi:RNA recognition motif-containing protein
MGNNLYVTALSRTIKEQDLRVAFERYGALESCKIICDPMTQESRGFGFVTFVTGEDAAAAI